jgi:hypothetical protein
MSVKRAQAEIDAEELIWWKSFFILEPWGEQRGDLRMGILASVMANINRGKDTPAFGAYDFMPDFERAALIYSDEEIDESIEEEEFMFEGIATAMGGQIIDNS